ncbi:MAG TPA: adenylate/guanylate cyclase domain-containing protein [Spirochaetota bacterium]|nr:adenylate/guanylate cyclase domain-containing protein [Spirochaetota bacterium]HPC40363.1 adenylate/guanylate cyclase domain-containing protein [Spirochaetota bacterium]HPL17463.1 adenylate/guanylate cyclase domain-containing protein [Spirochaetota bacterium]HQF07662.1 adenylate/guanylate cyclase domain-containing protein [Spirochaetota bacterium]HQH96394.1 adenylate/guanylate cyclase domain-containing protein [Spirochaetota bacterium]
MPAIKIEKNRLMGMLITLAVFASISVLFTLTTLMDRMELGAGDFLFFLRDPAEKSKVIQKGAEMRLPNKRARKDIIIIGIDERTIRHFSDQGIQWPFPWEIHAKFMKYIGTGKPIAILADIMFLDHKKGEDKLADAIRSARNVFLDFPFETKYIDKDYGDQRERLKILYQLRFPVEPGETSPMLVEEAVPPTPLLSKAARGIGFANIFPGSDNVIRTMPLLLKWQNWYYPSIDLLIVMQYYGIGKDDIEIKWGKYIKLKNLPPAKMARPNAEREIKIPIDKRGFMDVNFIGGFGSFEHYPYSYFCRDGDMLKENNTSLKDKIVLVAAYAVTGIATDEKQSPYGATFGIEHHANVLNTILNQNFLIKLNDTQNLIIMLVIAVLMGLIVSRISIVGSFIFTMGLAIAYMVGSYVIFDMFSYMAAFSTPVIQIGLTFTLVVVYRVLTEQREKRFIKQTFSKFVSPKVVDDLLKSPEMAKLGGERKTITVLFSDIRGFTSMSEKMTPEELVDHLNLYLQAMTDIVIKYDGTLDKYVGDEIMAFWGAPVPQQDHALLACKAAIEMMSKLEEMNREWKQHNKETLDIGIGLNTGAMVVGFVGSTSRMDYTLMGDMVNLGARLEGTNKIYSTHIIISEFTYEEVKDSIVARELDLIRVKGKEKPVKIYELLDMKNA